jgi:hypothetical protein
MPLEAAVAIYAAADLCAAVREHLRDSKSGERKGLAKVDHATILVESEKTDTGPRVACISSAFNGEPGGKIQLTRREALIIDGSDGVRRCRIMRCRPLGTLGAPGAPGLRRFRPSCSPA